MAVKSCRAILIAATLVVHGEAVACKDEDPVEISKSVTSLNPLDIQPKMTSVGNIHSTLWDVGISSEGAVCQKSPGSLKMVYKNGTDAKLIRGTATCQLQAIRLEATSASAATMFLDYQRCPTIPTRAIVAIDLEKIDAKSTNGTVLDFVDKVCGKKEFTSNKAVVAKAKTKMMEVEIGKGQCKGKLLANFKNIATNMNCRQLCMAESLKYANLEVEQVMKMPDTCFGYDYNTKTRACNTFKADKITELKSSHSGDAADWVCKAVEPTKSDYGEKKLVAPTAAPVLARLKGDMAPDEASIMTYHAKVGGCTFETFDWIRVQHSPTHQAVSLKIPSGDWDALMKLIPAKRRLRQLSGSQPAVDIKVDRAVHGVVAATTTAPPSASNTVAAAAVTKAPTTIVAATVCTAPEFLNAIISGVLVPAVVWILVIKFGRDYYAGGAAGKAMSRTMATQNGYTSTQNGLPYESLAEKKTSAPPPRDHIYVLIGASLIGAALISFAFTQVLSIVFKPMCDSSEHDLMLITIATSLATFVGCAIGLYMFGLDSPTKKQPKFMVTYTDEDGVMQTMKPENLVDANWKSTM